MSPNSVLLETQARRQNYADKRHDTGVKCLTLSAAILSDVKANGCWQNMDVVRNRQRTWHFTKDVQG
eukprot:4487721-Amphidinium_carterae.1